MATYTQTERPTDYYAVEYPAGLTVNGRIPEFHTLTQHDFRTLDAATAWADTREGFVQIWERECIVQRRHNDGSGLRYWDWNEECVWEDGDEV